MLAVSNTSPLSNLAIIGQLELIGEQLGNTLAFSRKRIAVSGHPCHRLLMISKSDTVTIRELRSRSITNRILAGERLTLRMGDKLIADIVPHRPRNRRTLKEILAPVKAAALKAVPGKNLILEDRKRFRR